MKSKLTLIFTLLLFCITINAQELLYLASGSALELKKVNPETGELSDFQRIELPGMSKFTFSRDSKFLYAQASIMEGKKKRVSIATYSVAKDGQLTFVFNAAINNSTTELKTDHTNRFLTAASYGAGIVSVWKLEEGVYRGELVQEITLEKKAHATRFSPDNKVLCIPATGPNKIFELAFDSKTGKVSRKSEALGPKEGAAQPRHLIFHPTLDVAYSTLERIQPGVAAWTWNMAKGELTLLQSLANSDDTSAKITNADLHLSPDQKFLYISSRAGVDGPNQIIAYKVNPTDGKLSLVKKFACETTPRSFCLNKSGDFAYVCGQKANKMGVYKINKVTGHLKKVTQYETGKGPIWVETLMR